MNCTLLGRFVKYAAYYGGDGVSGGDGVGDGGGDGYARAEDCALFMDTWIRFDAMLHL